MPSKNFIIFLCMCKMSTYSIKTWRKIGAEAIKYNDKKWINEKHLETALGYKNLLVTKLSVILTNLKKEDMKYKIVKIFNPVENLLQKNQQFI